MAVIISDAGPIIALAKINQLQLLSSLFSSAIITQSVADECLRQPSSDTAVIAQALKSGWLRQVENPDFKHFLSRSLGLGEKSSIEYALQIDTQALLIMDDALARKQALRLELKVVGTAALLFTAQHKGLIQDAELLISELRLAGYRISEQVVAKLKTV